MATSTTNTILTTQVRCSIAKRRVLTLMTGLAMVAVMAPMGISTAYAKGSIKEGAIKARACQVCHGKGGKSVKEAYPILAGQHAAYLRKQLQAFRAGTRKDPIMNGMAVSLSDQDIEDIAAFFSRVE